MGNIKIYAPPIITAKGKIKLGHGANLVWCDILARTFAERGDSTEYHFPSWNHQGKMFGHLSEVEDPSEVLRKIESVLENKLALFGLEEHHPYRDTDDESRRNSQERFKKLVQRGFIEADTDGGYSLRIDKIEEQTDLVNHIMGANFYPRGGRKRMRDLTKTLNGAYPIAKPREFATPIPGEEDSSHRINPIFDLAVSPLMFSAAPNDYTIDGLRTMLHGTFIPFVIYSGLFDMPFSRNVAFHGYSSGDSNLDVEEFHKEISAGIIDSDVLRYCALQCTGSFENTEVNLDRISGAKKLLYRALNISRHILKHYGIQKRETSKEENSVELTEKGTPLRAMNAFESGIFAMSRKIHHTGRIDRKDITKFLRSVNAVSPIFPITIKRIREIVYDAKT